MATGVAPSTIGRGLKELAQYEPSVRIWQPGAGRKRTISKDPTLLADLEALVEPTTRGDPESPFLWTCKSARRLAQALQSLGHQVSRTLVAGRISGGGLSGTRSDAGHTATSFARSGLRRFQRCCYPCVAAGHRTALAVFVGLPGRG